MCVTQLSRFLVSVQRKIHAELILGEYTFYRYLIYFLNDKIKVDFNSNVPWLICILLSSAYNLNSLQRTSHSFDCDF